MTKKLVMQVAFLALAMGTVSSGVPAARAQDSTGTTSEATRMDALAEGKGELLVKGKLAQEFNGFLGKDSMTVVSGLRTGQTIALAETIQVPGQPPTIKAVRINPPTGKMGYGNVFISLALAKQQLSQAGITQPTPSKLQAALVGGSVTNSQGAATNLQGVLALRSQGMGWGQIAQAHGTKLGTVVGGLKAANHSIGVQSSGKVSTEAAGQGGVNAGRPGGAGAIVTGTGEAGANGRVSGDVNTGPGKGVETRGGFSSQGHGSGRGIVSGPGVEVAPTGGAGVGGRGGLGLGLGRGGRVK